MRRVAAAAVLALVLAGSAAPDPGGRAAPLTIEPLDLGEGELRGVTLTGAWRLESPHEAFGGLSGLLVEGGQVTMVGDQGWWFSGRRGPQGLEPRVGILRMTGNRGEPLDKRGGDAEGLTRRGGRLVVSFERDHRIAAHIGRGRLGRTVRSGALSELAYNGGLEALATLPDGRLLAVAEEAVGEAFPVFLVDQAGSVTEARLPKRSRHQVTGADVGPDGKLYLLRRFFSVLTGLSIRLDRYHLGADGLPDPRTAETLAAWESTSGIDNMEGVAAFRDEAGATRLWLLSDDNFNALQRSILVELLVE